MYGKCRISAGIPYVKERRYIAMLRLKTEGKEFFLCLWETGLLLFDCYLSILLSMVFIDIYVGHVAFLRLVWLVGSVHFN